MKRIILSFLLLYVGISICSVADEQAPSDVKTIRAVWHDDARNRDVPFKIYFPAAAGKYPVIIFSHGLGGTCDGYEYIGVHWAKNGYVSVHIQHKGSDDGVWRGKSNPMQEMRKATMDFESILNRPKDVSFAIDQIDKLNKDEQSELKGRCDMEKIGVAGHSFGAYTALASSGRKLVGPLGGSMDLSDPRIKACIAMSAPAKGKEKSNNSYADYKVPCMHMTGTLDDSPIGDTKASDRRIPFDSIEKAEQYLVIFKDGDHMIFSGRGLKIGERAAKDKEFQELIKQSTVKFWDAYLKDNSEAKKWLTGDEFEKSMGNQATIEKKIAK